MNILSLPPLFCSILFIVLGVFVIFKNPKSRANQTFGLMCLVTFWWQFSWFILFNFGTEKLARIMVHVGYSGIIFIPYTFYHFFITFLKKDREKFYVFLAYFFGLFFLILNWTSSFYIEGYYKYFWGYYPKAGFLHPLYLLSLFAIGIRVIYLLYREFPKLYLLPFKFNQIKYLLLAFFTYTLASFDFAINYGLEIYPIGFIFITISLAILAYTILKYNLLDIRVALTRAGIFVFVYLFVLGIPFVLSYKYGFWRLSNWVTLILATAGPFIFMYLRRSAEAVLFKDQRRYQRILIGLSKAMGRIRDLDKLYKTIIFTVVESVHIPFAVIYLKDEDYKGYHLKHYLPKKEKNNFQEILSFDSDLIKALKKHKRPLLSEEIQIPSEIDSESGLFIPCFIEDELLGFIILAKKYKNFMYTIDDVLIFEALSLSTALAIENCTYWHEIEERQRRERVAEMDLFSYSLAHEIDNPMTIVLNNARFIKRNLDSELKPDDLNTTKELCEFTIEAAQRVSGMVKAIQDLGQKIEGELKPLDFQEVTDSFLKLYQPIFRFNGVTFTKEIPEKMPVVNGIKPQLMEILVNMSNNSIHALLGVASGEKKIHLKIELVNPELLRVSFSDNGYGITDEKIRTVFAPFVTTKASTEGKGMGLYIIKRIIQRHNGRIWVESAGKDKGATFFFELPILKDVNPDDLKNQDKTKWAF